MKKTKSFNVGDKVFAKVKGYPAWPAKVVNKNDKKYDVLFYGTKETGSLKAEDIFYYLKHKSQLLKKSINRKFYIEAVEEIEADINEAGTDGNENPDDLDLTVASNISLNGSVSEPKSATKRKRSKTPESEEASQKKISKKNLDTIGEESQNNVDKEGDSEEKKVEEKPKKKRGPKPKKAIANQTLDGFVVNLNKSQSEDEKAPPVVEEVHFNYVSEEYLQSLVDYASKIKENKDKYTEKSVEERMPIENQALVVKALNGDLVAIKYNFDKIPKYKNELDRAEYDSKEASYVLELAEKLKDGSVKAEDDQERFVASLNKTEEEIKQVCDLHVLERKKKTVAWLQIELQMVELDTKIKGALGMDSANPEEALKYLKDMLLLNIEPLMLKKHGHVVEMIKRLRKYIGNMKAWQMSEDEEKAFNEKAEKIRKLAIELYDKFKAIFKFEEETSFLDFFNKEVEKFKEDTKTFTEEQVFALCCEPGTRDAILDQLLSKKDVETVDNENKENSTPVTTNGMSSSNDKENTPMEEAA